MVRPKVEGKSSSPPSGKERTAPCGLCGVLSVVAAVVVAWMLVSGAQKKETPVVQVIKHVEGLRLFTASELSQYSGKKYVPGGVIFLSVLGSVFDVTNGERHYGPAGTYSFFTGKDASRSFVTGEFTDTAGKTADTLDGLSPGEIKEVVNWRNFYRSDYTEVGKLVGTYYDHTGAKTPVWEAIEAALREAEIAERESKEEQAKYAMCNSKWSQAEGGMVWCDKKEQQGQEGIIMVPRILKTQRDTRCACISLAQADPLPPQFAPYKDCPLHATHCPVV